MPSRRNGDLEGGGGERGEEGGSRRAGVCLMRVLYETVRLWGGGGNPSSDRIYNHRLDRLLVWFSQYPPPVLCRCLLNGIVVVMGTGC